MLPSLDEKEWKNLLLNKEIPPMRSLSLKLKLASLKANLIYTQGTKQLIKKECFIVNFMVKSNVLEA